MTPEEIKEMYVSDSPEQVVTDVAPEVVAENDGGEQASGEVLPE